MNGANDDPPSHRNRTRHTTNQLRPLRTDVTRGRQTPRRPLPSVRGIHAKEGRQMIDTDLLNAAAANLEEARAQMETATKRLIDADAERSSASKALAAAQTDLEKSERSLMNIVSGAAR